VDWSHFTWKLPSKHVIEEKVEERIEVAGRRRRRRKQLLYDFKERRGYCKLKEEALDHTKWEPGLGRSYGPVVRQTTECTIIAESKVSNGSPPGQGFEFNSNSSYIQHMQVKSNVQQANRLTLKEYPTLRLPMFESTGITNRKQSPAKQTNVIMNCVQHIYAV
jgi:hypothetical protein